MVSSTLPLWIRTICRTTCVSLTNISIPSVQSSPPSKECRFQFCTCLLGTMLYPEGGTSFIETLFLANWKNVLKLSCRLPCQWPPTPLIELFSVTERVDCLKKRQGAFLYLKACLNQPLILTLLLLWLSFILRPK